MADLANKLKIKYGLRNDPTPEQIRRWEESTREAIARGIPRERAGETAAQANFIGYKQTVYASEADTIETLLLEAGKKK